MKKKLKIFGFWSKHLSVHISVGWLREYRYRQQANRNRTEHVCFLYLD